MKVALCQIDTILGKIDRNIVKISNYVDKAIYDKCDMVVFPELALSGYGLRDLVFDVALKSDDSFFDEVKQKSKDIDIVFGYVEEDGGYTYNSALYFSKGNMVYNYRKNFLPDYGMFEEGRYFASGNTIDTIETDFGKVTLFICEDSFHISAQDIAFQNNTDILIILSASPFWMDSKSIKPDLWKSVCSNFTQLSGSYAIFANRVGFEDGVGFFGNSFVMDTDGNIIKEAKMFKEEMLIVEFDERLVLKAKSKMPILKNEVARYAY